MNLSFSISEILFILVLLFINTIAISSLLRAYYLGNKKFKIFIKLIIFISKIPAKIFNYIKSYQLAGYLNKSPKLYKHKEKKKIQQFHEFQRDGLLVLARYDHYESRSLIEIIDLKNFKIIHSYKHDIGEMNKNVKNKKIFPGLNTITGPKSFLYWDPLIFEDGSLICDGNSGPLFKIDINSKLEWINDKIIFHHSKALDHEKNYWVCGRLIDRSKMLKEYLLEEVNDDAIVKIDSNGDILFKKSVIEILFENKLWDKNHIMELKKNYQPIHLNCIEPALSDTKFWKKGDLFLNLKHQSQIILYRPSQNKIISSIKGPFSMQHDIKIVSEKEISFLNNNNFLFENKFSEVMIYNFENRKFSKIFNEQLKKENFKTYLSGKSQILNDGSLFIEEQRHGRIILFNKNGDKEWEYVNVCSDGNIGYTSGCKIIENKIFLNKFRSSLKKQIL